MSALWRFLCLDKAVNAWRIYKQNGGILGSLGILYRTDTLKQGRLVGTDEFGNRYFENNEYSVPKNRWVVYSRQVWLDYDGSQVPSEWHRWLHHIGDHPPTTHPPEQHRWLMKHESNRSGLSGEYTPYSTTRPKIEQWQPGQLKSKSDPLQQLK